MMQQRGSSCPSLAHCDVHGCYVYRLGSRASIFVGQHATCCLMNPCFIMIIVHAWKNSVELYSTSTKLLTIISIPLRTIYNRHRVEIKYQMTQFFGGVLIKRLTLVVFYMSP